MYSFVFKDTQDYHGIDEFYSDVANQGYKLNFVPINKQVLDRAVENGQVYLFEIKNKDNNDISKKQVDSKPNLETIYWNALFTNKENKPKLNGEAEIFFRPAVQNLDKKKDKQSKDIIDGFRFSKEKFIFHCPITLNFGARSLRLNDELNKVLVKNKREVCFLGIDRGEKHLAYYSLINQNGEIIKQGSFNVINGFDYNAKLEKLAQNRDEARKNWQTINTIKELKNGYISQLVHEIVTLAVAHNAYIVLEDLSGGFKNLRKKIEKSIYQNLELAVAKKLNFLVDKDAEDNEIGSVQNALQLTPPVTNFSEIEKAKQFGMMLYVRANYTSQTDPVTGWRRTIYFKKNRVGDLVNEIKQTFDEIGFDGQDYYFIYTDKNVGKKWTLYSGKNGVSLDRFRGRRDNHNEWQIEKQDIARLLDEVFGKQMETVSDLKDKITSENVSKLKFALELIMQIRNTGVEAADNDFILSPVRDEKNGEHFDSRSQNALVPNGDANGAYNIARKGLMTFEKIEQAVGAAKVGRDGKEKINYDLYIEDKEWDGWVQKQEKEQ